MSKKHETEPRRKKEKSENVKRANLSTYSEFYSLVGFLKTGLKATSTCPDSDTLETAN